MLLCFSSHVNPVGRAAFPLVNVTSNWCYFWKEGVNGRMKWPVTLRDALALFVILSLCRTQNRIYCSEHQKTLASPMCICVSVSLQISGAGELGQCGGDPGLQGEIRGG